MSRRKRLASIPFGWYYFARTVVDSRDIVRDAEELRILRQLLARELEIARGHLHFAHIGGREIHLVAHAGEHSLAATLGGFCQRYSRLVNRHRGESGPLFRQHAHVLLFQFDRWFLPLGRFVHWLARRDSPDKRADPVWWNSDGAYRERSKARGLVTSLAFRMVSHGSRNPEVQDHAYRAFFDQPPSPSDVDLIHKGSAEDARILGDAQFIARFRRPADYPQAVASKRSDPLRQMRQATAAVVERFKEVCDERLAPDRAATWKRLASVDTVCSKSRHQPLPLLRGLCASHMVAQKIATVSSVERFLNCRPGTFSAQRRQRYQAAFSKLFGEPYERLLKGVNGTSSRNAGRPGDGEGG